MPNTSKKLLNYQLQGEKYVPGEHWQQVPPTLPCNVCYLCLAHPFFLCKDQLPINKYQYCQMQMPVLINFLDVLEGFGFLVL